MLKVPKEEYYNILINSMNALAGTYGDDLTIANQQNYKLMVDAFITPQGINNTVDTANTTASFVNDHYSGIRMGVYPILREVSKVYGDLNFMYHDKYLKETSRKVEGIPPNERVVCDYDIYDHNGNNTGSVQLTYSDYSGADNYQFTFKNMYYLRNVQITSKNVAVVLLNGVAYSSANPQNEQEVTVCYEVSYDPKKDTYAVSSNVKTGYESRNSPVQIRETGDNPMYKRIYSYYDDNGNKHYYDYYDIDLRTNGIIAYPYYYYVDTSPPEFFSYNWYALAAYGLNLFDRFIYAVNIRDKTSSSDKILEDDSLRKDLSSVYFTYNDFDNSVYNWVDDGYLIWDGSWITAASEVINTSSNIYYQRGIRSDLTEYTNSSANKLSLMNMNALRNVAVEVNDTCWIVNSKIYDLNSYKEVGIADNHLLGMRILGDTFKIASSWGELTDSGRKIYLSTDVAVVPEPVYIISKPIDFGSVVKYILVYSYYIANPPARVSVTITGEDPSDVIAADVEVGVPIYVNKQKIRIRIDMYTTDCGNVPEVYSYGVIALGE